MGTLKSLTKGKCFVTHDAWILDNQVPLTLNLDDSPGATLSHTVWVDAVGRRAKPSCGGIKPSPCPYGPLLPSPGSPIHGKPKISFPKPPRTARISPL